MGLKLIILKDIKRLNAEYIRLNQIGLAAEFDKLKTTQKLPRIVFVFTLNGRSIRQVFRIIKSIYDDLHFYYFHVDGVSDYLMK